MKKFFKSKKLIGTIILLVVVVVAVFMIATNFKAEVSSEYLNMLLSESSELTTAKLTITGFSDYKDTGVVLLNRSDFSMVYEATVRAGIDLKDVEVRVDNKNETVKVKIPSAKIHDVKVDPKNIKYFNEKFSLFNVDEKEDANKAQELAETHAKEYAATTGILEFADEQAKSVIKGIFAGEISGYEIKFEKK